MRAAVRFLSLLCLLQLAASLTLQSPALPIASNSSSDDSSTPPTLETSPFRSILRPLHWNVSDDSGGPLTFETSPFRNILLVVHCRLKRTLPLQICVDREPLFDGYRRYFGDVLYLTRNDCPLSGDPHLCVAGIMKERAANRDGVFYIHFDSLIRPRNLAASFNKNDMFSFDRRTWCGINQTSLAQEHCICAWWSPVRARVYQRGVKKLLNSSLPEFANVDPWQFWIGNDDMFYIPSRLFRLYRILARSFRDSHHEIAGPTIRVILSNITDVPSLNLACTGSCCVKLEGQVALRRDFRCGHAFDLSMNQTRDAFPTAIATHRDLPMEGWRKLVQEALE